MRTISDVITDYLDKQSSILFTPNILVENGEQTILFKLNDDFYLDYPIQQSFILSTNLANNLHKDTLLFTYTNFRDLLNQLEDQSAYETTVDLVKHIYRTAFKLLHRDFGHINFHMLRDIPTLPEIKTKIDLLAEAILEIEPLLINIEEYVNNGS